LVWADVGGTILGEVVDPSGAAVVGATVTLVNPNTGLNRSTKTDNTGSYQFLAVPVGSDYTVTAESAGFEESSQAAITLLVNQKYRADLKLQVGTLTQKVTVSAQSVQVE